MNILNLPPYYFPEQIAGTHLTKDLDEALVNAGFKIEILAPTPTRGISEGLQKQYKDIKHEERYEGEIQIHRFPMFREGKNPILRALRYMLVNIAQYFKGIRAKNIDVILGASTPPTQGILCALVKKRLKVPFVYNLQDIFPDSMVNAGMTREGSLLWKIGRRMEDFTYRNADKIIVISEGFKQNIMGKGVPAEKIKVIPNWVDESEVVPIPRAENKLIARYNLDPDKFYVSYCGNIGHSQNFEMLTDAAKQLDDTPEIQFVIIGEGAFKPQLEAMIKDKGLQNMTMIPFQPYEDIAHVFSLGDVGLVISKSGIGSSSVPSKTWSIMSAGRPILASFDLESELCKIVQDIGCGVVSKAGNLELLKAAVKRLHNDQGAAKWMGLRGRKYIEENLNKEKCVQAYIATLKNTEVKR